jgi:hypothetical protein
MAESTHKESRISSSGICISSTFSKEQLHAHPEVVIRICCSNIQHLAFDLIIFPRFRASQRHGLKVTTRLIGLSQRQRVLVWHGMFRQKTVVLPLPFARAAQFKVALPLCLGSDRARVGCGGIGAVAGSPCRRVGVSPQRSQDERLLRTGLSGRPLGIGPMQFPVAEEDQKSNISLKNPPGPGNNG